MICPNLNNPQVREQFNHLTKNYGENLSYYLWNKYNGEVPQFTAAELNDILPKRMNADEAKSYLESKGIPVTVYDDMIQIGNAVAHGYVANSAVNLWRNATEGTQYHEEFHYVFRHIMNDAAREQIYKAAEEEYGAPTKEDIERAKRGQPGISEQDAYNLALEEKLAEEYKVYQITDEESGKGLKAAIRNFFKRLHNFIKTVMRGDVDVQSIYYMIDQQNIPKKFVRGESSMRPQGVAYELKEPVVDRRSQTHADLRTTIANHFNDKFIEMRESSEFENLSDKEIAMLLAGTSSNNRGLVARKILHDSISYLDDTRLSEEDLLIVERAFSTGDLTELREKLSEDQKYKFKFSVPKDGVYPELDKQSPAERVRVGKLFFKVFSDWIPKFTTERDNPLGLPLYNIVPTENGGISMGWRQEMADTLKQIGYKISFRTVDAAKIEDEFDALEEYNKQVAYDKIYSMSEFENDPTLRAADEIRKMLAKLPNPQKNSLHVVNGLSYDSLHKLAIVALAGAESMEEIVERLQKRANTYQELKPLIRALSGEPDENGVSPWTDQDRALFKTLALEYTTKALMNERYVDKNVKRVVIINSDRRSVGLAHKAKWEETNVGYGKEALGTWLNKLSEDELSEGDRKYVTRDIVADMEVNGTVKSLPLSKRVDILYKEMLKISGTDEKAYKDRIEYMSRILWEMGIRFGDNVEVMIQGMLDHLEDNYGKFTKETFQTFSTKDFKFYSILKSVFDVETPAGKSRNILSIKGTKEQAVNVFDVYGSSFRFLGETVASKVDNQVAVSYIDGMGKLIWPFNMGSHRTFLFKHWVNGDEFFEQFKNDEAFNGFGMYQSTLLRLGMSKNFEIVTFDFDVFKSEDDDIADDGASGKTLSPRHQMMVEINAYLNSGEDFAYYPIPTQGTRNKVTFVKLPRFTSANSMNAAGLDASTISFEEHLRNIIIQDLIRISRDESAAVPPPRLRLMNLSGLEEELFETVEDDEGNTITRIKKEYHINGSPITNYMNEFNLVMFTMGDIGDESDPIYLRNKEINQKILALVTQLANHYIENVYPSIFEAVKKEALDYNLYQFDEVVDLEGYTALKAGQKMSEQTFEKVLEEDSGLIFLTEEEGKNWTKEWKDPSEGTPLRFSRYLGKSNKYLLMTYEGKETDNEGRTLYKLSYEKASPEEMPQTTALKGNLLDSVGLDKIATGSPEERFEVALDKYVKDSIIAIIELSKMLKGGRQHYKDDAAFFKRMEVFGTPGSTAYYKDESLSGNYGMSREYNESTISEFTTSDPEHDNIARRVYDELINNGVELSEAKRISDALYAMGVDSADGQRIISEDFYVDLVNGYYGELTEEQTEQYKQYRDGVPGVKNPIKYHRPLKMIYVGIRDTSKRGGLGGNVGVAPEDDKSSDVVISKELAAMSPTLQDIYDRMHLKGRYEGAVDPETNQPLEPIHVITQPTVKKGRKDTVFTYQSVTRDENGVPVETRADLMTLNNKYINKQLTKHLRMVQTINESKSNVSTIAKQFRKNTLAGLILNGNEDYYLNRGFESFNPETDILSGKELHDLNQAATSQIMINALAELKKDLGYADLEDAMAFGNEEAINKARLFFLQRIRDILYEEKFEKGFMDENMSKQLKIMVDESGYSDFVMSLSFPVYEKSYQSILFSLFKNRVYKLKTKGKELVQVADFGKIYRDPVTGENRELRFTDVQQDALGSLVGAAEVMISWDVAEQYGLKPGDDLSQIPEELRRVISYRVPHQGKSSTFVGTIVGILPKSYKKTIVVPGNITVVMGSDFDVDKMFVMFPELIKSAQEDQEALEIFNNLSSFLNSEQTDFEPISSQKEFDKIANSGSRLSNIAKILSKYGKGLETKIKTASLNSPGESYNYLNIETGELESDVAIDLDAIKKVLNNRKDKSDFYEEVVLHEEIHRYTQYYWNIKEAVEDQSLWKETFKEIGLTDNEINFVEEVEALYAQYLQNKVEDVDFSQPNSSIQEFITYGLTNPAFMQELQKIKVEDTTLLEKLIKALTNLLNNDVNIKDALSKSFETFMSSEATLKDALVYTDYYSPKEVNQNQKIQEEEASELKDQIRQIVDSDIEAARVLYAYVNELREPHSMPAFTRWLIEREGVKNILSSFVVETRRAPSVRSLEEIPGASLQSLRNTFFDTVEAVATSTLHLKESVEPLVTTPIEDFILNEMETNWDSTLPFESPLNNILVSERARDSASLIGTWANSLSGMAIISSLEDGLPMDTRVAFPVMGQVATRLNMFSETTGNSVSDLIKMRLSGALDYANTPFPTAVNENRFTFNMKMFIDVQTGDHRYADLIASTPLVKEFVRLRRIEGFKPRQAFIKVLESVGVDGAADMVDEAAAGMSKALKEVPYSKIMEVYKNNDSTSSEAKAIFMTAMVSHYAGQSLMNLFDGISTDSAEEYGDIAMMQAQGSTIKDYLNGTNVKIFGTDAVEKILVGEVDENGVRQFPYKTHATYFAIAQESLKMTSEFLMSAYESVAVFKDALSELTGNYGYGPKAHRMINRALAYMLMTQEGSPVNTLLTRDNIDRLYTNKKTKLSNELRELQRIVPALRNNSLFRQLQVNEVVSGLETIIIDTVKNQDSDASRADMIAAFSRMMYHPEIYTNNAELQTRIEQFAKDLVINSLVTSAAAPSYGSYYTYIPFEYWMKLTGKDGVTMSEFMRTELKKAKADPKYFEQFMFEFIRTYGTRNPDKRRGIVQLRNWRLSRKGEEAEQFREIRDQIEQKLLKDAREKYEVTSNDKLKKSVLANISRKAISFANNMAPISVSVREMGFEETDDGFAMVENMPMLVGIRNKDNRENPITIYMRSDKKANGDFVYIPVQSKGFGSRFYETGIVDSEGQLETSSIASYFKAIPNNLAVTLTEVVSNSVSNSVDLGIEARRAFIKPASDLLTQKCK